MPTFVSTEDELQVTLNAIASLTQTCDAQLLVIDDESPRKNLAKALEEACEEMGAEFGRNENNSGFARTVNVGLRRARDEGKDALLVNADMFFMNNGWLDHMRANSADVVGALLLYPNGLVQHAGIFFSVLTRNFDHIYRLMPHTVPLAQKPRICPVTGALQLIRNDVLVNVGMYDENFRMGYEDVSYCHDVFASGRVCAMEPRAVAVHYESLFRNGSPSEKLQEWSETSLAYLHEKHKGHSFAEYTPTMLIAEDYE